MDTELLRTFLEVSRTRHFGRAADNLFVTQSAVSARIKLLEETIGAPLFQRARNNIQLTPAGQKLVRHAEGIVNLWNRARQQVVVSDDVDVSLSVSGVSSLWDIFLQDWLERLLANERHIMLHVDVQGTELQLRMLRDGTLDLGFMFEMPNEASLTVRQVASIPLVMVTDKPGISAQEALKDGYVLVDWGTSFANAHAQYYPDMTPPILRAGLGRIAYSLLTKRGGAAYLAEPMVRQSVDRKKLFLIEDAPVIERAAYAVYAEQNDRKRIIEALLSPEAFRAFEAD